jgi:glycosyltransferase involved in cell wall biosynthesis
MNLPAVPVVEMKRQQTMRIAIVAPCFGVLGGIETFICALAKELHSQPAVEVTLCFKKTKHFNFDPLLESTARATGAKVIFVERASRELAAVIRQADIVHCQNPCFDVAVLAKLFGKRLVVTMHSQRHRNLRPREVARMVAWHLADRRWYNSEFCWNTWDPGRKKHSSARLPVVSSLPTGVVPIAERRGFVFVARWIPNKGIDFLVEAYAQAKLDRKQWPLILMGDGPLRPAIEAKIRDENIEGIVIKGYVAEQERNETIRHARWMVTPPNTKEDLGLTPMEARNVAVPVIITRDGGLPEAGGRHALVCEPGNVEELKVLLEKAAAMESEAYGRLCEATHQELKEYLQPLTVYCDHYRQLLGHG